MRTLFYVSSTSPLMYDTILKEKIRNPGGITVVTTRQGVFESLVSKGIDATLLEYHKKVSVRERDRMLFTDMMPGEFGDACFPDSDLPIWEVMAIDRLKFWYTPPSVEFLDMIGRMVWDVAYVSFDIGDPLPFSIGVLARDTDRRCVAVKTEPIRTSEIYDMRHALPYSEYYVWNEHDVSFLKSLNIDAEIKNMNYAYPIRATKFIDRKKARENFGVPDGTVVSCILFDKRDERQCRKFLDMINEAPDKGSSLILLYPIDDRSRELIPNVLHKYMHLLTIIYDKGMLSMSDEIVSFRWDDGYCLDLPFRPVVFDIHNVTLAVKIAHKGTDIRGFDV